MKFSEFTLAELGHVSRGRSRHRPRHADFLYGGNHPFFQTGDVRNANLYLTEFSQTYSDAGLAQSKKWPAGTLCITIAANIAEVAILGVDACFPDSIIGFVAEEQRCDVRYVKYWFDVFQKRFQQVSQGAAQDNLSLEKLLRFRIPVPELSVQNRIADILYAYDKAIEINQTRIALLEEAAEQLFTEWFVRLQFPGNEHGEMVKGTPNGWAKGKVNDLVDVKSGYAFKSKSFSESGLFQVITIKHVKDGRFDPGSESCIDSLPREMPRHCILQTGDILLSLTGNIGRTCLVTSDNCLLNQRVAKLVPKFGLGFAYCFFRNEMTKMRLETISTGVAQQNLSPIKMCQLDFDIPPLELLKRFEEFADPICKLIISLHQQNRSLGEARDLFLPRLMSGEIEV
ncbi:EcoKI restriction-modification system protein HsdS [Rubripirellula obstinata]|uniref:EcoKI restriction-modification system protein HsdS n=1 Tax=Rubripirellula obstinata TaxID=406547 RepID=A0A5B1CG89_9BACT|nr:restriction endonuclease subunit S [Rubripirellula obstinata]KAA1258590.1 EcoKI restriction-modification system protein HsdS [Rubripirellula obstinata]